MDRPAHYGDFDLVQYVKRRMPAEAASDIEAHAGECPDCHARLDFYRKVLPLVNSDQLEPPEEWIAEAFRQFSPTRRCGEEPPQVFAELTYDSFIHGSEGSRSRALEQRRAQFQSADFQVNIMLQTGGGLLQSVIGQLRARNSGRESDVERTVAELRVGDRTYLSQTNRWGEFLFSPGAPATGDPLEVRFRFNEGPCLTVMLLC